MTPDALMQAIEAAPKPGRTEMALAPEALSFAASLPELDRVRLKQRLKAAGVVVSDWWRSVEAIVKTRRARGDDEAPDWQRHMVRGEDGRPLATARNLGLILRNWEHVQTLRLNQLTLEAELEGSPLTGGGEFRLRERIEQEFRLIASADLIKAGTAAVAEERAYHPIKDWLDELPPWDGTSRLARVHTMLLRAPDEPIYARMVTAWFVSTVARVYLPGCQADSALVLFSTKGGLGKSTWFDAVTGDRGWATRGSVKPEDKDSLLRAHRVWVQVLDELDDLTKRSEWSDIKRWQTERGDIFRAPYAPRPEMYPRRFVFGGTTNKQEYMPAESAAARRFWTLPVGEIDLDLTLARGPLLWAEARHMLFEGTARLQEKPRKFLWWLTPKESDEALALAADHQPTPLWKDTIESWIGRRTSQEPITLVEVLEYGMKLEKHQFSAYERAAGDTMRSLGYVSKNSTGFADGKQKKAWVKQ